jgi:hypothetical protein
MGPVRKTAAVLTLLTLPAAAAACGGTGSVKAARVTAPTSSPPPAVSPTTPAVSPTTMPPGTGPSALPVGAAGAGYYPFGYTVYRTIPPTHQKTSKSPPNTDDVNFAAIESAPTVGPFDPPDSSSNQASWPPPCSLTSIAQLHGLFSAITGLDGKPEPEASFAPRPKGTAPRITGCDFNLDTSFYDAARPLEPGDLVSIVTIVEAAIGPDAASAFRQAQRLMIADRNLASSEDANYPSLPDGVSCSTNGGILDCLKGYTYFQIYGAKVTGGPNLSTDGAVWIDQIEIPLAVKLGSELPA